MLQALANSPNTTAYMFGVDHFYDSPCAMDYDPYVHAQMIGASLVSNMTLPRDMPAAYSHEMDLIFFRGDQLDDEERCNITHEIVHFEHKDDGNARFQEDRAERTTALRLIRPSRLSEIMAYTDDHAEAARELRVTEKVMRCYLRMARNGTLPRGH